MIRLDPSRIGRWRSTAETWARKTSALLRESDPAGDEDFRWLIGYEAGEFMKALLWSAHELVPLLVGDQADEVEKAAKEMASDLRRLRLSAKMENTTGRTPEEAEAFARKVLELRQ